MVPPTAPPRVRLLGPLEIEVGGTPRTVSSGSQRVLLAHLALVAGQVVPTERLMAALWADAPPPSAVNSLQSHLARLRRTLGDADLVTARPPGYVLQLEPDRVDAVRFERLLDQARVADDPERRAELLAGALALWHGPALAEFEDGGLRDAGTRLDRLRRRAATERAEALLHLERPEDALAQLDAVPAPGHDERPTELAMRALARLGRTAEADEAFQRHRAALAEELGLDPSPAVQALHVALLRGELADGGPSTATSGGPRRDGTASVAASGRPPWDGTASPSPSGPRRDGRASAGPSGSSRLGRVPSALSTFLGREHELAELDALLERHRLITVVGPGGVGKTRLVAEGVRRRPDVVWVDLAAAADAAGVRSALAVSLGGATPGDPDLLDPVLDALAEAPPSVLVLDNVEQVAATVGALLVALLRELPATTFVTTSRERLGLDGEAVLVVPPLAVTPAEEGALPSAVVLLIERAAPAIDGDDPEQRRLAAELAAALDGLPLAIELAAGHVGNLGLAALLRRFDQRLDLLAASRRGGRPEHRGLRELVRWSTDLLEPAEVRAFHRIGVFAGGFTLELAEAVLPDDDLPARRIAPLLSALVDRSLLVAEAPGRFRMLGILRTAALEGLAERELAALRRRHATAVAAEAESLDRYLRTPAERSVVGALQALDADLTLAHRHAVESGDLALLARLAAAVHHYAYHGLRQDLLAWGEEALAMGGTAWEPEAAAGAASEAAAGAAAGAASEAAAGAASEAAAGAAAGAAAARMELSPGVLATAGAAGIASAVAAGDLEGAEAHAERARAYAAAAGPAAVATVEEAVGDLCLTRGDAAGARSAYERMQAAARRAGSGYLEASACFGTALVHAYTGELAHAAEVLDEAQRIAAELGSPSLRAWVSFTRGELEADRDPEAALAAFDEARTIAETVDNHLITGVAKTAASSVRARHGDPGEALERFREVLEHWRERGNTTLQATTLRNLTVLLARIGLDEPAAVLAGAADVGLLYDAERRRMAQARAAVAERLGAARAEQLAARGSDLDPGELLETARRAVEGALRSREDDPVAAAAAPR